MSWFDSGFHFDLAVLAIVALAAVPILIVRAVKARSLRRERQFITELVDTFDAYEVTDHLVGPIAWPEDPDWQYATSAERHWSEEIYEEAS